MQGECMSACWGSVPVTSVPSSAALLNAGQIHPEFLTSLDASWVCESEIQDVTDITSCTFVVYVYAAKKTINQYVNY